MYTAEVYKIMLRSISILIYKNSSNWPLWKNKFSQKIETPATQWHHKYIWKQWYLNDIIHELFATWCFFWEPFLPLWSRALYSAAATPLLFRFLQLLQHNQWTHRVLCNFVTNLWNTTFCETTFCNKANEHNLCCTTL